MSMDSYGGTCLRAAFSSDSVPVVFAANEGFVPMFAACMQSLLEHTGPERSYDLVLIHTDISRENRARLLAMTAAYENVSLRFFDAGPLIGSRDLQANAHITAETYFRFLIQQILPDYDKVLYLDSDLIVNADVAALYDTDLEGNWLGAVRDPEFLGHLNNPRADMAQYAQRTLKLANPQDYFQAGVLLLNTQALREAYTLEQWLDFASVPYRYNDQDVLNMRCHGRVKYLDMSWNLLTDCDHTRISRVIVHAPEDIRRQYQAAREAPRIIHYAGYRKPWHKPSEDMAPYFWSALKKTPYYEEGLYRMACFAAQEAVRLERRDRSARWKLRQLGKKLLLRLFPERTRELLERR